MVYTLCMLTVKQLSDLAGITRRTLHYYDEIDLLKPTETCSNGYRYYGEDAILRLQQILLYRQLGLSLDMIRRILNNPSFDVIAALQNHKKELKKRVDQLQRLEKTVDDTILYIEGKKQMSQKQLFKAFSEEEQAKYEEEAKQMYDPEIVKTSNEKWRKLTDAEKQQIGEEGNAVYRDILQAMPNGASSPEVQACIERWRKHMEHFWSPNDDQLLGLANLYNDDPRFKANFDKIDHQLAAFMREAVKIYVEKRRK